MSDCVGCGAIIPCPDLPDSVLYNLQNVTLPYVINCPPGYSCQIGSDVYFNCCTQLLHASLPTNPTSQQITAILNVLANQCAILSSACGELPNQPGTNTVLFWNTPQSCTVICPDGTPFTYDVPAGVVVGTSQAKANAGALTVACNQAAAIRFCITDIFLNPTSPPCTGKSFSTSIRITTANASNFDSMFFWSVTSGSLPPGLSLSMGNPPVSATISGTPTMPGSYTFSITVTAMGGNYVGTSITKSFTLTIGLCAQANVVHFSFQNTYVDDNLSVVSSPAGSVSFGTGKIGQGLVFDPGGGFSNSSLSADLTPMGSYAAGGISLAFWINLEGTSGGFYITPVQLGYTAVNTHAYWLVLQIGISGIVNNPTLLLQDGLGGSTLSQVTIPITWSLNTWVLLCLVYDPALQTVKCSVNGGAFTTGTGTFLLPAGGPFNILNLGGGFLYPKTGLDEYLVMRDYVLTTTDVAFLYNAGAAVPWPYRIPNM